MKIILSEDDVMRLICEKFNLPTTECQGGGVIPEVDNVYWEGNSDPDMLCREAAKELKKKEE